MTSSVKTRLSPEAIIDRIPPGPYSETFQPPYDNRDTLEVAIHELQHTTPVTTPDHIRNLKRQLRELSLGETAAFIVIEGSCAEAVSLNQSIDGLVNQTERRRQAIMRGIGSLKLGTSVLHITRDRGQAVKPRSSATELHEGMQINSYFGDAVNGQAANERTPDPSRMVAMAIQARDLEEAYTERFGVHLPAAHEALLMPYEMALMQDGYVLSADLPWIGMRTNGLDHPIVEMLSGIENPVGVKIGSDSTAEHIRALDAILNPDQEAGKVVFMLRIESEASEKLDEILTAIAALQARPVVMYDIHGVTVANEHGEKIRSVLAITDQISDLADACKRHGLELNGLHLETMADNSHTECVDRTDDRPSRPGFVDPRLNPGQLEVIVRQSIESIHQ